MNKLKRAAALLLAAACLSTGGMAAEVQAPAGRARRQTAQAQSEQVPPGFVAGGMGGVGGYGALSRIEIPESRPVMQEARFTAYAYCACQKCCGKWAKGITASGTTAAEGRTIAVDPDVIALGTRVYINGREYIAEDTGSGINGRTIDIFFGSHRAALEWGRRTVTVRWPA